MTQGSDLAVVFFSRDGNTRRGAEILCGRLGGRLVELKEVKRGMVIQALLKRKSLLEGDPWAQIAGARRVYLMAPIWAGHSVPAMNAFAARADFTDKDVYIVTFQQSPNHMNSHRVHQHIAGLVAANHGSVRDCIALVGGKMGRFAGEERIRAEIDRIAPPVDVTAPAEPAAPEAEPAAPEAEPEALEAEPEALEAEPEALEAEPAAPEAEPAAPEAEPAAPEAEPEALEAEPEQPPGRAAEQVNL